MFPVGAVMTIMMALQFVDGAARMRPRQERGGCSVYHRRRARQSSNLQSLHPACTCTESFWLQ
jgi:hypothetical protein